MFDELPPLIRRPFELTNLYQLDTNIFDGVDYACTQSFDILDELQRLDQGSIPKTFVRPTKPSLLIRTTEASLKRLVQIKNKSSAYLRH
jgi:hypothetical protein